MSQRPSIAVSISLLLVFLIACKTSGPGIFGKKTPHEQYADGLINAGLQSTALGQFWFRIAEQSIASPLTIAVPYKETGYFAADRPVASGLRFNAVRGQKLSITLEKKPTTNFAVYIDLWKIGEDAKPKHVAAADATTNSIQHEVNENRLLCAASAT